MQKMTGQIQVLKNRKFQAMGNLRIYSKNAALIAIALEAIMLSQRSLVIMQAQIKDIINKMMISRMLLKMVKDKPHLSPRTPSSTKLGLVL